MPIDGQMGEEAGADRYTVKYQPQEKERKWVIGGDGDEARVCYSQ